MLKKIVHYSLLLAAISGISIFGVSLIYSITFDAIQQKNQEKTKAALSVVLKGLEIQGNPEKFEYANGSNVAQYEIYVGLDTQKQPQAWAIQIGEQGYSSVVQTMIGVDSAYQIIAIEVVYQQETPGLGTECISTGPKKLASLWSCEIEPLKRPWFQEQFNRKSLDMLELKKSALNKDKEIQAISGATITSAAITRSVQRAIKVIQAFRKSKG